MLIENAKQFNTDLEYDWINYTTHIWSGVFFHSKSVPNAHRYFKETIQNQQVQYEVEILQPTNTRFIPLEK